MERLLIPLAESLKQCGAHDRQADGGVDEDFTEAATFIRRDEFAPGDGLRIRRAGKASPVDGLRADADAVMVALEWDVFSGAADTQFTVRAELLRPVARHAAADGEDADLLLRQERFREVVEVKERIVAELGLAFAGAHAIVERHVETKLRVSERGHKDGNIFLKGRLENAAAFGVALEVLADGVVQLPGAHGLLRVPFAQDFFHHQLHVIKVGFRFERVIDAVVARLIELFVVHARVIAIVVLAGGFYESVGHESAGGDQGVDQSAINEIADDEALLGNGHGAGKSHDDEAVAIAGHGFKHVNGFAELASGEGRIRHGAHEFVNGFDLAQIKREDGRKFVTYRIMQLAVNACAFLLLAQWALSLVGWIVRGKLRKVNGKEGVSQTEGLSLRVRSV